jgi:hypothetical protein
MILTSYQPKCTTRYCQSMRMKHLNVPVQAIGPLPSQKLRYLFHILVTSFRQTLVFGHKTSGRREKMRQHTHNDEVGHLRHYFYLSNPFTQCMRRLEWHMSGSSAKTFAHERRNLTWEPSSCVHRRNPLRAFSSFAATYCTPTAFQCLNHECSGPTSG